MIKNMIKYYDLSKHFHHITEARMGEDPAKMAAEYHKKQFRCEIGDIVRVIENGQTYDSYESLAKVMGLKHWVKYDLPENNKLYKVVYIHNDYKLDQLLIGIQSTGKYKKEYIIGLFEI